MTTTKKSRPLTIGLYQEVYYRGENLRLLGIPESMDTENTSEVVYCFFEMELEIENARDIEFQRVHRIGKKKVGGYQRFSTPFLLKLQISTMLTLVLQLGQPSMYRKFEQTMANLTFVTMDLFYGMRLIRDLRF